MLAALFTLFVIFLYGPMIAVLVLSFQGPSASLVFPLRDPSLLWFDELFSPRRTGDVVGAFYRSLPLALFVMVLTVLISVTRRLCLPPPLPRLDRDLLHGDRQPDRARAGAVDRHPGDVPLSRLAGELVRLRPRRASVVVAAVRAADHVRGARPAQPVLRGGRHDLGAIALADGQGRGRADRLSRHDRGRAVRLHAVLRRVPAKLAHRRHQEHAAARDLDDDHQRHVAGALCARARSRRWCRSPSIALALSSIILIQRKRSRGK